MESLDSEPGFMDELLNFSSDIDEEEDRPKRALASSSSLKPNGLLGPLETVRPFHEYEEDLEWISNKDAFPAVESFVGILSDHHPSPAAGSVSASKHHSPVSVLDGSTITMITTTTTAAANHSSSSSNCSSSAATALTSCFGGLAAPRRARSKRRCRRRRGDVTGRQLCWSHPASRTNVNANANANANAKMAAKKKPPPSAAAAAAAAVGVGAGEIIGRKCQHCGAEKTPQWRAGPYGPKTLCNACGVRYKSGRLVPEYRPASSPSFSTELHSNSHRKILEMRRVKQAMGVGVKQPLESG